MVNVISHFYTIAQRFRRDEAAATTIEYGVAAVVVVALISLGADKISNKVETVFSSVEQKVSDESSEIRPAQAGIADKSSKRNTNQPSNKWQLRP